MPTTRPIRNLFLLVSLILTALACGLCDDTTERATGRSVQVGWITLSEVFTTNGVTDISFSPHGVGYAAGGLGTVLKSTDNGRSWLPVPGAISGVFTIFAVDDDNVFAASARTLYRSSNGGSSWWSTDFDKGGSNIFGLYFISPREGLMAKDGILRSTDWGSTWVKALGDLGDGPACSLFSFLDPSNGYCAGGYTNGGVVPGGRYSSGFAIKTFDGGRTWSRLKLHTTQITTIDFISPTTGYICNIDNEMYKTTDGGNSWNQVNRHVPGGQLHFVDEAKGIVAGSSGIYYTDNGGMSWHKIYDSGVGPMRFINKTTGFFVGDSLIGKISLQDED